MRWTSATNARSISCGTCAAPTSWESSFCSFPRNTAASAAARSTCTASAKRWRASTWGSRHRCSRRSWAAIRSPWAPRRSRRRSGWRASPTRVCCSPTAPPSPTRAATWARCKPPRTGSWKVTRSPDTRINGSKQWISNGGIAGAYTVLANTPGGPSWFIVEQGAAGFTQGKPENKHGIRLSNTAALSFSDV